MRHLTKIDRRAFIKFTVFFNGGNFHLVETFLSTVETFSHHGGKIPPYFHDEFARFNHHVVRISLFEAKTVHLETKITVTMLMNIHKTAVNDVCRFLGYI